MKPKKELVENQLKHELLDKVRGAYEIWDVMRKRPSQKTFTLDTFFYIREYFRDFLESVISGEWPLPLPDYLTVQDVEEIYLKSDFDWRNYEEFNKFYYWFLGKIEL